MQDMTHHAAEDAVDGAAAARGIALGVLLSSGLWVGLAITLWTLW